MDKLVAELIEVLRELLERHQRLLAIATARREAMRTFDVDMLNILLDRERVETEGIIGIETRRRALLGRFGAIMGRGVQLTVSEVAKRTGEPMQGQLLALAAKLKSVVEELERANRINSKVSHGVVNSIARVLKVVTGMAQHAGLYMRNGRKASVAGVHLLDAVA